MSRPHSEPERGLSRLTTELVEVVADARNETPTSLPPLSHECDPEALARFLQNTDGPTTVTFEVYDCTVLVESNGDIRVVQAN